MPKTKSSKPEPGSVSWRTMRNCDLAPAFLAVLEEYVPDEHTKLLAECPEVVAAMETGDDAEWWDSEEATLFVAETLWEAMDEIAPDGHYFGAHEANGADYGFWPCETDGDESEE